MIKIQRLSKRYNICKHQNKSLFASFFGLIGRNKPVAVWALKDIDLFIGKSETVGIIGENGSGKSTLLRILAGITAPTEGQVNVNGRIVSLLDLGAGFHPELTGRENIYLCASLYGLTRNMVDKKIEGIIEFSELRDFIDVPVKQYSSGMFLRLGFSILINLEPDVLLIDEILTVGDEAFQKECIHKIKEFKSNGKTIIFVSHDLDAVLSLCDRVVLLRDGRIAKEGGPLEVVRFYHDIVGRKKTVCVLKNGLLELVFNSGKVHLYFDGKPLTKEKGLCADIFLFDGVYNSDQAEWQLTKSSSATFIAKGRWHGLGIGQVWTFNLLNSHELVLSVDLILDKEIQVKKYQITLMVNNIFDKWFFNEKCGNFIDILHTRKQERNILQWQNASKLFGILADEKKGGPIVSVAIEQEEQDKINLNSILDNVLSEAKTLQCSCEVDHKIKEQRLFSGKIAINKYKAKDYEQILGLCCFADGKLKIKFEAGCARIFVDNLEITKKLCLYTSLRSSFGWNDSTQVTWDIKKFGASGLLAYGLWRHLPIAQTWTFELGPEQTLKWKIMMEVFKEVNLDREQVNVMLSRDYGRWLIEDGSRGIFPGDFKKGIDDDWERLWMGDVKYGIGVEKQVLEDGKVLPSVVFKSFLDDSEHKMIVVNSESFFEARVLQNLRMNRGLVLPGQYPYFEGEIKIGDM